MNRDLDTDMHPMVSLKVGYFITAVPNTAMGNLCVVPGSHRLPRRGSSAGGQATPMPMFRGSAGWPLDTPPDALEIIANEGDAVIFDRRLWHSASTNTSACTRVFLTYGYSYRWLRPKSAMHLSALMHDVDPVRRQLMGAATSANGYFDPTPDDVPLREWIRRHLGDNAVSP